MLNKGTRIISLIGDPPFHGIILSSTVICGKVSYLVKWDNGGELWVPDDMIKEE